MAQKYSRGSPGKATKQSWWNLGGLPGDNMEKQLQYSRPKGNRYFKGSLSRCQPALSDSSLN